MDNKFRLIKKEWTEKDFEEMAWHDSYIHSIEFLENFRLSLDIDYLFKWIKPENKKGFFKFWVSPCTLIFENVYNLQIDLETSTSIEIQIDSVERSNPREPKNANYIDKKIEYDWVIKTHQGEILFTSIGYKQLVNKDPILSDKQYLYRTN